MLPDRNTTNVVIGLCASIFAPAAMSQTIQQQLQSVGNAASGFQRLHVAEALVNVGAPAEAAACLQHAPPATQPAVGYSIVVRRILAYAGVDRDQNIAEIKRVACDPTSPDRLHAVEALAKLKAPADADVTESLQGWIATAKEEQKPFIDWLLIRWNNAQVKTLDAQLRSANTVTRQRTAYVIRSLPPDVIIPAETLAALQEAFEAEKTPAVRTSMLAALYMASPESDRAKWEQQIDKHLTEASPAETADLVTVLGLRGSTKHRTLFENLSQSPEIEVRMAALVALYRIDSDKAR